ncbi:MAG TPA: efflux RND transporter periplasmic adaptor subunit [Steroidobacteraceae bacterium]|nr:efflux RND transporter periplasmic adaptor subunit [Steroidobacteraceae bacterium]
MEAHSKLKWKLLSVIAASVLGLATVVFWFMRPSAPIRYVTAPVTRATLERKITATGTVNPVLTIIIGSYVSGVISTMSCDYNTRVKKGQLCAKIDPRPYQAVLDQASGQLKRDEAQLEGARVDLERYAASLARNAIAKQTYDDQVALVHQLEGTVQLDRGAVETARVNLEYTNIISPVDGTVVARNITIGQTVAASFQTPTLFLIATDLTQMQVDTNVSESDIGTVKEGDKARFTVEAFTDRSFEGTVVQVRQAPQTVQNVVTYDVVVGVNNAQFLLKPGMTATVGIVTDRRANVLSVPDQALRYAPAGRAASLPGAPAPSRANRAAAQVWVLHEGKPMPVPVSAGLDDDVNSEIISGNLREGDQVIVGEQRTGSGERAGSFKFGL